MSFSGWFYVVISSIFAVVANLLLRIGLKNKGCFDGSILDYLFLFKQFSFVAGLFFYVLATVSWIRVLSSEQLNIAYPILVSITFTLVIFFSSILFNETLSIMKMVGVFFLFIGIVLMSQS